ncbi:unnamed protein product [Triticum turgidum subsp. durum]|uniref:NB-ARC domain-containing protein n=1 Tax=Triticum turgidum subsp. durum TaxID=4567 RepID=A0A9R0R625_TRITD|nr:unnamed protein product [Triticum turgidum subsp. durum]
MLIEGVAWGISVIGWILSPLISKLVDKVLSHVSYDKSNELDRLLTDVLPRLTLTLQGACKVQNKKHFEGIVNKLKSAFYKTEDILDEFEYIRHQKELNAKKSLLEEREKENPNITPGVEVGPSDSKMKGKRKVNLFAGYSKKSRAANEAEVCPNSSTTMLPGSQSANPTPTPTAENIWAEPSLTVPGPLRKRLTDNILEIEELIRKAQGMLELAEPSSKDETITTRNIRTPTTSTSTVKVTGRDEDLKRITASLRVTNVHDNHCFSVIGLHGISGSGKTILAQHVCKYEKGIEHFELVMWIHVTRNYSVRDIFMQMFELASGGTCTEYKNLEILEKELADKIKDKRFLLVLDDIWCNKDADTKQLPRLLSPFEGGKRGSKILATSQNVNAFSDLGPDVTYTASAISTLDDEVLLDILMHYALGPAEAKNADEDQLRSIGADIVKKLNGSPLAASTVGGTLRKRKEIEFWRDLEKMDLLKETRGPLWLSYQHLDEKVRRCFAYCSIFPRRHPLRRDDLVKLWVAEGFIQTDADEDMDVVGRDYFHELVAASFLQPGVGDWYVVHDLMHGIAVDVAGRDCFRKENPSHKVHRDVRHLYVSGTAMVTQEIYELENLRTLIIDDGERSAEVETDFFKILFENIFKKLQKLRVLLVRSQDPELVLDIPETVGQLKYLRYLGLGIFEAKLTVPETVQQLYHLQVLEFGEVCVVKVSPGMIISNLTNLRHILGHLLAVMFRNIGRLTSLQTLQEFHVGKGQGYGLDQLKDLNKLRGSLAIENLENVEGKVRAEEGKLADKIHLTGLKLRWKDSRIQYRRSDKPVDPNVQEEVLEALCPPKDLKSLEISCYRSQRYPSWMVDKQKDGPMFLQKLELSFCPMCKPAPEIFQVFTKLRKFTISNCMGWDRLPANLKDLKLLESLKIQNCKGITSLPDLPASLKKFELLALDQQFMESCERKDSSDWKKLEHVKEKIIEPSPLLGSTLAKWQELD